MVYRIRSSIQWLYKSLGTWIDDYPPPAQNPSFDSEQADPKHPEAGVSAEDGQPKRPSSQFPVKAQGGPQG